MARCPDMLCMSEYIKNVLYFAIAKSGKHFKNTFDTHYFCIDDELTYENYYNDFGPLNLGCVYKYCQILNEKLDECFNKRVVVHYTSCDPKKKANAAFVLGCYGILFLNLSPKDALRPLTLHGQIYRPFQDATIGDPCYTISLLDCLQSMKKAKELGFFMCNDFNYEEYVRLDRIQGGDLNWIVPGKFLAFIGPVDYRVSIYHPPEMYIDYFKKNNVKVVIRLNKRLYDGNVFNNVGIVHYDLFFPDGECPPRRVLFKFLQISEECDGAIAVHCKAGLGRTGSLIGCYLIKHYRMTAHEAIGWMRICRPGSVIGHQQAWLEKLEPWLTKQGNLYRHGVYQDCNTIPRHEFGVYSISEQTMKRLLPTLPIRKHNITPSNTQRPTRADIHPIRTQGSKTKEVREKANDKDQYSRRVISTKPSLNEKSKQKGDVINIIHSRRPSGAGETLGVKRKTPGMQSETLCRKTTSSKISAATDMRSFHAVPTFKNAQTHPMVAVNSPKAMGNVFKNPHFEDKKHLNSSIVVTSQYPLKLSNLLHDVSKKDLNNHHSIVLKSPDSNNYRRRLGRSPSPPQIRASVEQHRATNTIKTEKCLKQNSSVTALKEALSRLKLSKPREKSIGGASLGARRDSPGPRRAPSVRSDEQPLATQGDMLNSIKFQRRFKDSLQAHKDRFSGANNGPQKRFFNNVARPASPKGRRSPL